MSSIASVPVTRYPWPADVLAFATKHKVDQYLEPLMEVTRTLFPSAEIKVLFENDWEYPEEQFIVFVVHLPRLDISDFLAADRKWREEKLRVCPVGALHLFVFSLE
jgi:hypothetical protein